MKLINGECIEEMKKLPDKSVDLFICDLPYGETNCSWDTVIDMEEFWVQFKRLRKSKRTACIHFCSTRFGYSLINSWEKGFKLDLVWKKRNKTGGLSSRYRPMRNHEMVYFFYDAAPKYNRDKYHKRINKVKHAMSETTKEKKSDTVENKIIERKTANFEPPNPASVINEKYTKEYINNKQKAVGTGSSETQGIFTKENLEKWRKENGGFEPKQPTTVIDEDIYGEDKQKQINRMKNRYLISGNVNTFEPPNPASIIDEDEEKIWGEKKKDRHQRYIECGCGYFEPRQPDSVFESGKVFIGKRNHQTEKPQDILEFFLKYWSDEGDVILDPTMGSGSTGVACKKMGREFIGIELTEKYYEVAKDRCGVEN
jgi:DNA modification methylase